MKTFWQFVETIKHQDLPKEDDLWIKLRQILEQLSHKEIVRFALFCAEEDNPTTKEAKECIRLIKQWLNNPDSVTSQQLRHTASTAGSSSCYSAAESATNAANTDWAADTAYYASHEKGNYEENMTRYINIANSMLSRSDSLHKPKHQEFMKNLTKEDLVAIIDYLQEHDEDILIQDKDSVRLNLPNGFVISGKTVNELVTKLQKEPWIMDYLRSLYK